MAHTLGKQECIQMVSNNVYVATLHVASVNTSWYRTTEPLLEASVPVAPRQVHPINYCHSDRKWAAETEEVIRSDLDSNKLFLNNDSDLYLDWTT